MQSHRWKLLLFFSIALGWGAINLSPSQASEVRSENIKVVTSETLAQSLNPEDPFTDFQTLNSASSSMEQVTSVSQLTDVKPTDWAFQALQSLVER